MNTYKTENGVYFDENELTTWAKGKGELTYIDLVNRFVGPVILCNEIPNIAAKMEDYSFYENQSWEEDAENPTDIYQWCFTQCNWDYVEWIKEKVGDILKFTYIECLDLVVLCVDHLGTPWSGVETGIKIEPLD